MRLGSETGSMVNHLQSRMVKGQPTPEVGMGATLLSWTDRNPGTIIKVETIGKFLYVHVQDDLYKRTDNHGMSEDQDYEYTPNPNGPVRVFRIKEGGMWQAVYKNPDTGRWVKGSGGLFIGKRERYYDFSF